MTIDFETRWVTPGTAATYLRTQPKNRILSSPRADQIARDLATGSYKENGDTVKLNQDGKMVDGQHRMEGVIRAAKLTADNPDDYKPFEGVFLSFACGVDEDALATIDTGRRLRTVADISAMQGGSDPVLMMAIVRWHLRYVNGNYMNANGNGIFTPTTTEALAHWKADANRFATTTLRARDARRGRAGGTGSAVGVAYHVLRTTYGDVLTENFFEPFVTGANMNLGHPILALRKKLADKPTPPLQLALIFRAWNRWIDGKSVDNLFFRTPPTNAAFEFPRDPNAKRTASPVLKDSDPDIELG